MIESLVINNSNNVGLDTFVEYPDEKNNERLAVLCPGYLDSKDYPHLVELSKTLAEEGFTVVRFDPSGTWMSGGKIEDYSISQYLSDIKYVINFLVARKTFKNVVLLGHSLGGMVSLIYSARDQRISEVVAIMAPYAFIRPNNLKIKGIGDGYKISKREIPGDPINKREFKVPYSMVEDSKKFDLLNIIHNIHIPLIFVASDEDGVVPVGDTMCIFDAANQPKKFILIKNVGHNYRRSKMDIKKVNKEIVEAINPPLNNTLVR